MELDAALAYVCKHWKKEQISDPFFVYSLLSDLCHTDYEEKLSISFLYAFDRRYRIIQTLLKYGGSGRKKLMRDFHAEDNQITANGVQFYVGEKDLEGCISVIADVIGIPL